MTQIGRSSTIFNSWLPGLFWRWISIQLANWERKKWRKASGFYGSSDPSIFHCPELYLMPNLTAREVGKCTPTVYRMKEKLILSIINHHMSLTTPSWVTQKKLFNIHNCLYEPEILHFIASKTPSFFKVMLLFYVPVRKEIIPPIKLDTHIPSIVRDILT